MQPRGSLEDMRASLGSQLFLFPHRTLQRWDMKQDQTLIELCVVRIGNLTACVSLLEHTVITKDFLVVFSGPKGSCF